MYEFGLGRAIVQLVPFQVTKQIVEPKQRDNHNKVGNNHGTNSDSKDCCFNVMDVRSDFVNSN